MGTSVKPASFDAAIQARDAARLAARCTFVRRDPKVLAEVNALLKSVDHAFHGARVAEETCLWRDARLSYGVAVEAAHKVIQIAAEVSAVGLGLRTQKPSEAEKASKATKRRARQLERSQAGPKGLVGEAGGRLIGGYGRSSKKHK